MDKIEIEKSVKSPALMDNSDVINDYTLTKTTIFSNTFFWKYSDMIKTITLEDKINIPSDVFKSWDVSVTKSGKVMAYMKTNASDSSFYDLYIQGDGKIYANPDSSYLFYLFQNVDSINNMNVLDTSMVTKMLCMFDCTGRSSSVFTLDLGDNFDTSNVTNMSSMFSMTGQFSRVFTLDLGDKFDTSKVTNMNGMFAGTGGSSTVFTLDLGDKFDTSNVTDMNSMFLSTGENSTKFTLDLGGKFDTKNVTSMSSMFFWTGKNSTKFTLDLGDKFDTRNVTDMGGMFALTGENSTKFKLDCSSWNVDKVRRHFRFNDNVETKVIPPIWKR